MNAYRLRPEAVDDLESIGDFIAADNPTRAVTFVDELLSLCERIAERPNSFQRRDDLFPGVRQAIHGSYLVLFTTNDEEIVIERVLHAARRLDDLL